MASRVLKRPMFRRGGMTNQGIMSGLTDRKEYKDGGSTEEFSWLDESGLGNILKFGGNLAMDIPSSVIDTAIFTPLNQGGRFFLGSNPGLSMNKAQESIKKSLFGENAEIYDPNNPDVFYHDEDANPNITEFFGINLDATPSGIFADSKSGTASASENDPNIKNPENNSNNPNNANLGGQTVNKNTGEPSAAEDIKTVYEDILPLLQSTLGVDDSELNRQKYLELAKFGANLMAQPGGSLTRAIGAAAEQPLEGLTRIAETKRLTNRKPAETAIGVALDIYKDKQNNPTAQKIKTIAKLSNRSEEEVANTFLTSTGEEQIKASQVKFISEGAVKKLGLNEGGSLNYTSQILRLINMGENSLAGKFTETLPDREDLGAEQKGNYYVDTNGDLVRWDGSKFLYISDTGFADKKKKK
jgi:hypothetical protein